MTKVSDLHRKWMESPGYRKAHQALKQEFKLAGAVIRASVEDGLSQEQLARRMDMRRPPSSPIIREPE
jgi:hypothetical protein